MNLKNRFLFYYFDHWKLKNTPLMFVPHCKWIQALPAGLLTFFAFPTFFSSTQRAATGAVT